MDLSKLPRLSKTPEPADNSPPPSPPEYDTRPADAGPEAWISIVIGAIVLLMQQRFLTFLMGKDIGWTFSDEKGQPIGYAQTLFFIHDMGITVFGLAMVMDGIFLLMSRAWAVWVALTITALASLLNLYTVLRCYPTMGLQIYPALAFALGVYIGMLQWKRVGMLRGWAKAQ